MLLDIDVIADIAVEARGVASVFPGLDIGTECPAVVMPSRSSQVMMGRDGECKSGVC